MYKRENQVYSKHCGALFTVYSVYTGFQLAVPAISKVHPDGVEDRSLAPSDINIYNTVLVKNNSKSTRLVFTKHTS
jgi:hypothetical protein